MSDELRSVGAGVRRVARIARTPLRLSPGPWALANPVVAGLPLPAAAGANHAAGPSPAAWAAPFASGGGSPFALAAHLPATPGPTVAAPAPWTGVPDSQVPAGTFGVAGQTAANPNFVDPYAERAPSWAGAIEPHAPGGAAPTAPRPVAGAAPAGEQPFTRPPGLSDFAVSCLFGDEAVNAPYTPTAQPQHAAPDPPAAAPPPTSAAAAPSPRRNLTLRPAVLVEGRSEARPASPSASSSPDGEDDADSSTTVTDPMLTSEVNSPDEAALAAAGPAQAPVAEAATALSDVAPDAHRPPPGFAPTALSDPALEAASVAVAGAVTTGAHRLAPAVVPTAPAGPAQAFAPAAVAAAQRIATGTTPRGLATAPAFAPAAVGEAHSLASTFVPTTSTDAARAATPEAAAASTAGLAPALAPPTSTDPARASAPEATAAAAAGLATALAPAEAIGGAAEAHGSAPALAPATAAGEALAVARDVATDAHSSMFAPRTSSSPIGGWAPEAVAGATASGPASATTAGRVPIALPTPEPYSHAPRAVIDFARAAAPSAAPPTGFLQRTIGVVRGAFGGADRGDVAAPVLPSAPAIARVPVVPRAAAPNGVAASLPGAALADIDVPLNAQVAPGLVSALPGAAGLASIAGVSAPGMATPSGVAPGSIASGFAGVSAPGMAAAPGITPSSVASGLAGLPASGMPAPQGVTAAALAGVSAPGVSPGAIAPGRGGAASFAPGDLMDASGPDTAEALASGGSSAAGGISSTPSPTLGDVNDSFDEPTGGVRTVAFPPPQGEAVAGEPATASASAPAAPAAPDPDELYEHVLDRLRHELLVERERLGSLIPELPE